MYANQNPQKSIGPVGTPAVPHSPMEEDIEEMRAAIYQLDDTVSALEDQLSWVTNPNRSPIELPQKQCQDEPARSKGAEKIIEMIRHVSRLRDRIVSLRAILEV